MTTLTQLQALVHQQTETTESELPLTTITDYLAQAFERTVNAEVQWPFYENTWALVQTAGNTYLTMPSDLDDPGIMSLKDDDTGIRLEQLDSEEAEDRYWGTAIASGTRAVHYSVWNDVISLWPQITFTADRNYTMRGFRLPLAFPTVGSESPDCDSRLHKALAHYATALAYAQQEDMELENQYMRRWQTDVEMARQVIMKPNHHRPLIMGPSAAYVTPIGAHGRSRSSRGWTIAAP